MTKKTVHVRNTLTGAVGEIPRRIFEHPVFNPGVLVEVESDAKPYVPELYRPRTADEYLAEKSKTDVQDDTELEEITEEETN